MFPYDIRAGLVARAASFAVLALTLALAACGPAPVGDGFNDPHEDQNRRAFERSLRTDRLIIRPVAQTYAKVVPDPVRRGVDNFAGNLGTPKAVVNSLLQGNVEDAVHSTFRFLINSTIGVGGIFDPATDMGLEERDTDFGGTLYVWGVPEGHFEVLPLLGPSTQRDTVGKVVDIVLDPLGYVLSGEETRGARAAKVLEKVNDRNIYSSTVDSIIERSADPYAQARLLYLENRRFELSRLAGDRSGGYVDPYAGAGAAEGPAYDPGYVDPYAEISQ